MKAVLDKIKQYNKIVIFRHMRPDGDAVGSTKGLCDILRATYPEKDIRTINADYADYVAFLGKEDEPMPDEFFADALGIIIDTATVERISNPQYSLCRELVKIDHHIPLQPYGDVIWVEEERSSACEMIAAFYDAFKDELKITPQAATEIYTGMVTDSGRFRFRSVSGDTLRLAGMLLDIGIDTDTLYANLYMREFDELKFQAYVYKKMKITKNGVAHLFVSRAMQKKFGLTNEQASASVSYTCLGELMHLPLELCEHRLAIKSRLIELHKLVENIKLLGAAVALAQLLTKKEKLVYRRGNLGDKEGVG